MGDRIETRNDLTVENATREFISRKEFHECFESASLLIKIYSDPAASDVSLPVLITARNGDSFLFRLAGQRDENSENGFRRITGYKNAGQNTAAFPPLFMLETNVPDAPSPLLESIQNLRSFLGLVAEQFPLQYPELILKPEQNLTW